MHILVIGDGPLAQELAAQTQAAGHTVIFHALDQAEAGGSTALEQLLKGLDEVHLVIEAVIGELTEKWDVITELDRFFTQDVPVLAATLNASATEVASWCRYPARVVGFAALPPLDQGSVIEFLPALQSSDRARDAAQGFWRSLGREPVEVADSVGGVLPRIVCTLANEAAFALMEGVASPADIDLAMQLGTNFPRGPLAWAERIRLDQVVAILEALGNEFGPDQYRPAPLLRQYARAGRGFYP